MQYKIGRAFIPLALTLAGLAGLVTYQAANDKSISPTYTPTITSTATPTSTPSPSPTPDPIYDLQRSLEQKVRGYEEGTGMNISIAVTDLQARKTISVDGDETHRPGCVINQFPLYTIVEEFQNGTLNKDDMDWYIRNSVDRSNPAS